MTNGVMFKNVEGGIIAAQCVNACVVAYSILVI